MPQSNDKKIGIIGAGISGFATAWELAKSGVQVDLFERDAMPGGLAGWFEVGGTTLEKFYHHIYNTDVDIIQFIEEIGLKDHLFYKATTTGCFYVNRIYRLSSPMDLLKYKPLHFVDRLRLGYMAFSARFIKDWHELDRITAKEWIESKAGKNVYQVLWEPLFRSKFGRYASEVSAAWLWSKLVQRGGSRSKAGSEELVYFNGGYGLLFHELEKKLRDRNVIFHYQSPVTDILVENDRVSGLISNGEKHSFDAVIAAVQLPDYLSMNIPIPQINRSDLESIGFLGNVCLILKLNHRLSETYWLNITDTTCPFVGVIEQTNLLNESNYQGSHLAYISRYMDTQDPYYKMNASEMFAAYLPYLKKIFPDFRETWIEQIYQWRESHAQAVVSVGFGDKIPASRPPINGLYLTTMAQIFPEDRQMSNGVKLARKIARMVLEDFRQA